MLFSRKHHNAEVNDTSLTLKLKPISWTDKVKYLGVTMYHKLRYPQHVNDIIRDAKMTVGQLLPLICHKSKMSTKNRVLLFKTIIRPIMIYAAPAWVYALSPTPLHTLTAIKTST